MTNNIFNQATALIMGSLVVFSGQALAFSPDNQEMTNTGVLDNSELLIAQCMSMECEPVDPEERADLLEYISLTRTEVQLALAATQASSFPSGGKNAIANALARALAILNDASAVAQSTSLTKGDAAAIAESIALADSLIGTAAAIAQSLAISEEEKSVAQLIYRIKSGTGQATRVLPI